MSEVDKELALDAHRDLLLSAVGNLLQNAFKFTHAHSEVQLNVYATTDRIRIEVEDHCGGLAAPGSIEKMFQPLPNWQVTEPDLDLGSRYAATA